jgi:hypothetical protein
MTCVPKAVTIPKLGFFVKITIIKANEIAKTSILNNSNRLSTNKVNGITNPTSIEGDIPSNPFLTDSLLRRFGV